MALMCMICSKRAVQIDNLLMCRKCEDKLEKHNKSIAHLPPREQSAKIREFMQGNHE